MPDRIVNGDIENPDQIHTDTGADSYEIQENDGEIGQENADGEEGREADEGQEEADEGQEEADHDENVNDPKGFLTDSVVEKFLRAALMTHIPVRDSELVTTEASLPMIQNHLGIAPDINMTEDGPIAVFHHVGRHLTAMAGHEVLAMDFGAFRVVYAYETSFLDWYTREDQDKHMAEMHDRADEAQRAHAAAQNPGETAVREHDHPLAPGEPQGDVAKTTEVTSGMGHEEPLG